MIANAGAGLVISGSLAGLAAACALFVGSHFLLSGPFRPGLVRALGRRPFLLIYSLVAFATFGFAIAMLHAAAPGTALWDGSGWLPWALTSVLTLIASVLLVGSFNGNPALPEANVAGLSTRRPWGIFRVTRHPMMMGIAIWAVAHLLVAPIAKVAIFNLSLATLALGGAAMQDRRKLASNHREWSVWFARTRFWPDLRALPRLGALWVAGVLFWLAATAAHMWLGGIGAGIWVISESH